MTRITITDKQISMFRELLTVASAALVAYGVGTAGIWEEITGCVTVAVTLAWSIYTNTGREQWYTMVRKTFSACGGVLISLGYASPDKTNVTIGMISSAMALVWSMYKLPEPAAVSPDDEAGPPA